MLQHFISTVPVRSLKSSLECALAQVLWLMMLGLLSVKEFNVGKPWLMWLLVAEGRALQWRSSCSLRLFDTAFLAAPLGPSELCVQLLFLNEHGDRGRDHAGPSRFYMMLACWPRHILLELHLRRRCRRERGSQYEE